MSEWKEYKLKDLGRVVTGNTPSSKFPDEFGNVMPFVTPSDYKNYNKWISFAERNLSQKGINKLQSRVLPRNSLLITCIGSDMGKVAINKIPVISNQQINSIIPNENIDADFLYYKLVENYDVLRMYGEAGTAVPIVNKTDFENIEIEIPSEKTEQKSISEILSSIDDKIDLLHRQNKTLEQLAETLFRQWFLPASAGQAGVEEAEESWETFKVNELDIYISDFVANGSFASLKENVTLINDREDYALFVRNTDLKSDFVQKVFVDQHSYEFLSKTKLFGGEVIISNVADVGSVHLCPKFKMPMTLGNNVIMLNSKFNYFLYLYFKSKLGQEIINGITSGSAQQKFNKTDFRNSEINIPSVKSLAEFHELVLPYFEKVDFNKSQIKTLTKLRDTLLPKLMSGEVRVNQK